MVLLYQKYRELISTYFLEHLICSMPRTKTTARRSDATKKPLVPKRDESPKREEAEYDGYEQLLQTLKRGKEDVQDVEAVLFGRWKETGFKPENLLPEQCVGKSMTLEQAKPYLQGCVLHSIFGSAFRFPIVVYTRNHIIITRHPRNSDMFLDLVPRNPIDYVPHMF